MEIHPAALRAMQRIMIRTRTMGYEKDDHAKIADVMDCAEYLPTILLYGEEVPNEFSAQLRHMANKWIEFTGIADEYDAALKVEIAA